MGKLATDFANAIEGLRSRFQDDSEAMEQIEVLARYSRSELLRKADEAVEAEVENEHLRADAEKLRRVPKIKTALDRAGVDLGALRPLERHTVEGLTFAGDEPSEEEVADWISEAEFPMRPADLGR